VATITSSVSGHHVVNGVLTNDEAYTWRALQYSFAEILERDRSDANPPLSYLFQGAWASCAGDSISELRFLSLLCGLLAVVLAVSSRSRGLSQTRRWLPDIVSPAMLLAIHPLLVSQWLTARMYAPGITLTGLTSFLLLQAVDLRDRPLPWLLGYAIAAAAFAWTHYFAFFTLAGQLAATAVYLAMQTTSGKRAEVIQWLVSASWVLGLAILVYSPWLPVFLAQRSDVQHGFWIEPVSWRSVTNILVPWATGVPASHADWLFIAAWVGVIAVLVYHANWVGWFFLTQAVVPWVLAVGYSIVTERSILYDRYFSFAAYAWLCFIGMSWARMPWPAVRRPLTPSPSPQGVEQRHVNPQGQPLTPGPSPQGGEGRSKCNLSFCSIPSA